MLNIYKYVFMILPFIILWSIPVFMTAQNTRTFVSLEEVWGEVKKQNLHFRNAALQTEIA